MDAGRNESKVCKVWPHDRDLLLQARKSRLDSLCCGWAEVRAARCGLSSFSLECFKFVADSPRCKLRRFQRRTEKELFERRLVILPKYTAQATGLIHRLSCKGAKCNPTQCEWFINLSKIPGSAFSAEPFLPAETGDNEARLVQVVPGIPRRPHDMCIATSHLEMMKLVMYFCVRQPHSSARSRCRASACVARTNAPERRTASEESRYIVLDAANNHSLSWPWICQPRSDDFPSYHKQSTKLAGFPHRRNGFSRASDHTASRHRAFFPTSRWPTLALQCKIRSTMASY